ncbi:MAG: hypothetical protein E3K32_08190 [wastewater metagenome]|nr:hypothetical protein [Candidatus Loosdrechtia aerotolerans]
MKLIYEIEKNPSTRLSKGEIDTHFQKLSAQGLKSLHLDIRNTITCTIPSIIERASVFFEEIILYCMPNCSELIPSHVTTPLFVDSHVSAHEVPHLEPCVHSKENKLPSDRFSITLFLDLQRTFDPTALFDWINNQNISYIKLFISNTENLQSSLSIEALRPQAQKMVQFISMLANRNLRIEITSPLPFCLFSESELGMLARECLPNYDYRRDIIILAINTAGAVFPWHGPMRSLVVPVENNMTFVQINNFYKVRRHELARRFTAFSACENCDLKRRGYCSANYFYSPTLYEEERFGYYPISSFPGLMSFLSCRIHSDISVKKKEDCCILSIKEDRTLSSQQLNRTAFLLWEFCSEHGKLSDAIDKVCRLCGGKYLNDFLAIADMLQRSGFLILEPSGDLSSNMQISLREWMSETWRNL